MRRAQSQKLFQDGSFPAGRSSRPDRPFRTLCSAPPSPPVRRVKRTCVQFHFPYSSLSESRQCGGQTKTPALAIHKDRRIQYKACGTTLIAAPKAAPSAGMPTHPLPCNASTRRKLLVRGACMSFAFHASRAVHPALGGPFAVPLPAPLPATGALCACAYGVISASSV